jgi:hypothetical protein
MGKLITILQPNWSHNMMGKLTTILKPNWAHNMMAKLTTILKPNWGHNMMGKLTTILKPNWGHNMMAKLTTILKPNWGHNMMAKLTTISKPKFIPNNRSGKTHINLKFKVIHNTMKKLKTIWIPCLTQHGKTQNKLNPMLIHNMAKLIAIMILESQKKFYTKPWQNFTTILNPKFI